MSAKSDAYRKDLGNKKFREAECWDQKGKLKKPKRRKDTKWQK